MTSVYITTEIIIYKKKGWSYLRSIRSPVIGGAKFRRPCGEQRDQTVMDPASEEEKQPLQSEEAEQREGEEPPRKEPLPCTNMHRVSRLHTVVATFLAYNAISYMSYYHDKQAKRFISNGPFSHSWSI